MIRLKHLLIESPESKEHINVLFVGDFELKSSWSFNKKLVSKNIVIGEEQIDEKGDSEKLLDILESNISDKFELVIFFCSGKFEKNRALTTIENYEIAIREAHERGIKIILNTFPTLEYSDIKQKNKISEIHQDINNWVRQSSKADFILDVEEILNDDRFFGKNGITINSEGHARLTRALVSIIANLTDLNKKDVEDIIDDTEKNETDQSIIHVQQQLVKLGFYINPEEIETGTIGTTTKQALKKFQTKVRIASTGTITTKTIYMLDTLIDKSSNKNIISKKINTSKSQPGKWSDIMKFFIDEGLSVAGAAAIAGNMKVESQFNPSIVGDQGTSYGLCQWHLTRKEDLFAFAQQKNKPADDITTQLEFVMYELETDFPSLLNTLKVTEDPETAAYEFARIYERPAVIQDSRKQYAKEYAESYDGGSLWSNATNYISSKLSGANVAPAIVGAMANIAASMYGLPTGAVDSGKVVPGGEGGDWAGSMSKALEVAKKANDYAGKNLITSQKRSRQSTANGNTSDHYEGSTRSYAVDIAARGEKGDELLAHLMQWFGHPEYKGGSWFNVNKNGYRYQFGWRVPDHYDHIHVGVKKI